MAESMDEVDGKTKRKCKPCLKKGNTSLADVFCSTCNEYQCTDCSNCHSLFDFMKDHKVLDVSKGPLQLDTISLKKVEMNGLDMCDKHNKRFKFYCKDENRLICTTCAIVDHRKCYRVVEIANIAKDNKCEELRKRLNSVISKTKETVENLKEGLMCLSADVQQIKEKLNKLKETFVQIFDDFASKVTEDAMSYRDKTTTQWTKKKIECERKIVDLNKTLDTIDDIMANGTAFEQFVIGRSMTGDIKQQSYDADSFCNHLKKLNVECNFKEHFEKFKANLMSSLTSDEFDMKYSVPRKTKPELITSIDLKQTGDDVGEPRYSGLDFLPDGRLVAVDNKNGKCLIYDENLNLQTSYKLPYDHPLGVVSVSREDITITAGERLDFLHISNTNEITLNRTCEVKPSCLSISMKDDENFVVGCIDDNIPVRMISMSGEEKTFDIEFPSKKYPIGTSFCTYLRGQDTIVLSDRDEDTIYIYDIKTSEKILLKDDLIKKPCDVAVGPCDHVFVCSNDTKSIVEITPGGRVLSSHQTDMYHPRYLAVSKNKRRLAVSNAATGARKLTMYNITSA